MTTVTPTVLWAQRSSAEDASKNLIYLTIQVSDPADIKLDLTSTALTFTADSADATTKYNLKIEFYDEINVEESRQNLESGSYIFMVLRKSKAQEEYWPRLTKEKLKYHYIKTDFDKWVDEDEQDEQPEEADPMAGMGGMPGMGGMGGMPGMEGMGGMPGMGGAGGMPGMGGAGGIDFAEMMKSMGSGGAGGDFDISKLASQLGEAGAEEGDEDDEEEAEASADASA